MRDSVVDQAIVFIGTYTEPLPHVQGKAEGIYVCRLDRASGALTRLSTATGVTNPSFVTLGPGGRFLYGVQEVAEHPDRPGGRASAVAVDPRIGTELDGYRLESVVGRGGMGVV